MKSNHSVKLMKLEWEAKATGNALNWIDRRRPNWDVETFFKVGEREGAELAKLGIDHLAFDPAEKRILDIGCGVGRLIPGLAKYFTGEIWGLDISEEMIRQGDRLCPVKRAQFVVGNGKNLEGLNDDYFDYVFSYIVFQHFPSTRLVWSYLQDVYRVTRPGGAFQLHFRRRHIGGVKGRILDLVPPGALMPAWRIWRVFHGSFQPPDESGAAVLPSEAVKRAAGIGFVDLKVLPDLMSAAGTRFWLLGKKR